jgi:hypothetical protein
VNWPHSTDACRTGATCSTNFLEITKPSLKMPMAQQGRHHVDDLVGLPDKVAAQVGCWLPVPITRSQSRAVDPYVVGECSAA